MVRPPGPPPPPRRRNPDPEPLTAQSFGFQPITDSPERLGPINVRARIPWSHRVRAVVDMLVSVLLSVCGIGAMVVAVVALAAEDWPKATAYLLAALLFAYMVKPTK